MTRKLPCGQFRWLNDLGIKNVSDESYVINVDANDDYGCIHEVDLEYPEELHDSHNSYPLAPENLKIGKVGKLVQNLHNKSKYIVHLVNLQLCLNLGRKLTKVYAGSGPFYP